MNTYALRLFTVRYLGPTNTRGARVRITDTRFSVSIIIPYNYKYNNVLEVARNHLSNLNIPIEYHAQLGNCTDVLLSSNFTIPLTQEGIAK